MNFTNGVFIGGGALLVGSALLAGHSGTGMFIPVNGGALLTVGMGAIGAGTALEIAAGEG